MGDTNIRSKYGNRAESGAASFIDLKYDGGGGVWTTVLSIALTTSGNPVFVGLRGNDDGAQSYSRLLNIGIQGCWRILRDGSVLLVRGLVGEFSAYSDIYAPVSAYNTTDFNCPAGSHSWQFQAGASGTFAGTSLVNVRFYGFEFG